MLVSDLYATVGRGLHRGSKAVHFEWENAKENLLYSKPYALCAISTGEVGYGERSTLASGASKVALNGICITALKKLLCR